MKKLNYGGIALCVILGIFAGCASAPKPVIGAEGDPRPEWVRKLPRASDVVYFVTTGASMSKNETDMKNDAKAQALEALGIWKESSIIAGLKNYRQVSGETSVSEQSLRNLESTSITRAKANTSGLGDSVEIWMNAKGDMVCLFEYPKADLKQDFMAVTNDFVRKEAAAFAEFKADEAYKLLEKEMAK